MTPSQIIALEAKNKQAKWEAEQRRNSTAANDGRECCMCFRSRPTMRLVEQAWWCVECHDQFTADMNSVKL